jgi:hypothetical protein
MWSATCRICGFTAKDINRRSAATWFLTHIRDVRLQLRDEEELRAAGGRPGDEIDLREPGPGGVISLTTVREEGIARRSRHADGGQRTDGR